MTNTFDIRTQEFTHNTAKAHPRSAINPQAMMVRYAVDNSCPFQVDYLSTSALHSLGLAQGTASAGRGNTTFFDVDKTTLVLRHYYRGGFARHLSKCHYVFTGFENTRAFREFDLLVHLQQSSLPSPRPYACSVQRKGLFYRATLITYRVQGSTMATRLQATGRLAECAERNKRLWQEVGKTVARFHKACVYHADLNAHNILIDDDAIDLANDCNQGAVTLIDFDKGHVRQLPAKPTGNGWCLDNVLRLERSCLKVASMEQQMSSNMPSIKKQFDICRSSWVEQWATG